MYKDNELIAEYMSLSLVEGIYYDEELGRVKAKVWMKKPQITKGKLPCIYSNGKKNYKFKHHLKYDKLWGEIIPVVRVIKMYQLDSKASDADKEKNSKLKNMVRKALLQLKIMPLHRALVDYIEFINKHNK